MSGTQLHDLDALAAAAAVKRGDISPVELVEHALDRIVRLDDQLGAFVTVTADSARQQAREAEQLVRAADDPAELPPFLGVPTAIKDLNLTRGVVTKLGSRVYADWVPEVDDDVVTLLRGAGTISLGKTATPEFGLPCYTETDIGPPARTPWDTRRLAGGSSGGAAAAVAGGFVPFAQGSDGGGSIRIPASLCGLVGLKPARGRVSKGPLDLDSSGLSVYGPLARTVRDAAAFLDVVSARLPGTVDPVPSPPDGATFLDWCGRDPGRLRVGRYLHSPVSPDVDPQIERAWQHAAELLDSLGHEVVDVEPPIPAEAFDAFEKVWAVSAATVPVPPEGEALLRPLTRYLRGLGRDVSGVDYANAVGSLRMLSSRGIAASAHCDAVLIPTLAMLPRPVGWFVGEGDPAQDFARQVAFTPFTAIYNTTGQPAISLPLYQSDEGLPIGVMLVGRPAGEAPLLALAAQLEAALPWADRHPAIWRQ